MHPRLSERLGIKCQSSCSDKPNIQILSIVLQSTLPPSCKHLLESLTDENCKIDHIVGCSDKRGSDKRGCTVLGMSSNSSLHKLELLVYM